MDLRVVVPDDLAEKLRGRNVSQEMMQEKMLAALREMAEAPTDGPPGRRADEAALQARFDEETRKIVDVLKLANPVKIIRFGSAARGDVRWKSDLDLCVVLDRPEGTPRFEMGRELRELLHEHHYRYEVPLDFHPYTHAEFEKLLQNNGVMLKEILKGEVVYERG